jgi:hypothetical protein
MTDYLAHFREREPDLVALLPVPQIKGKELYAANLFGEEVS